MSKHASAEDKLHIRSRGGAKKLPPQKVNNRDIAIVPGPPTGTNSKNQFR